MLDPVSGVLAFVIALQEESGPLELEPVPVPAPHEDTFGTQAIHVENLAADRFRLEQQVRSLPDAVRELPGVGLQRTGPGQSSPFLRGFTGFRTLFVLDGFRFNHSAWRDGPNQYFGTIDSHLIDHLDVRFGSGSVRYGSDAIGGTIVLESVRAGSPVAGQEHGALFETRFASAERSSIQHLRVGGELPEGIAYTVGSSWFDYGDVEGGRHVGVQDGTAYQSGAADFKLAWRIGEQSELVLAHQLDRTDDASRTHATLDGISWRNTAIGSDLRRDFDQDRDFTYARLDWREGAGADRVRAGLGYHSQGESEVRIRSSGARTDQDFDVDTVAGFVNLERETFLGRTLLGVDGFHDTVDSGSLTHDPAGALQSVGIQGPVADEASYDSFGLFGENEADLGGGFALTAGARAAFTRADADSVSDPATGQPIALDEDWWSWAADLRLRRAWNETDGTWLAISRAVRVPNLSDLTRFDIALSGEIETPSPGLDPEEFTTVELGGEQGCGGLAVRTAVFVTFIEDMIVRFPTGNVVNGSSEIQKANVGDGRVHGVELALTQRIDEAWSAGGDLSWVDGSVETFLAPGVSDDEPLGKVPPLHGGVFLRWDDPDSTFWIEGICRISDRQDRLSPLDERDTQRVPPDGTPGYTVVGVRAGASPTGWLDLVAAVENITNVDYRLHGSGVNEPGTNAVLTARVRF